MSKPHYRYYSSRDEWWRYYPGPNIWLPAPREFVKFLNALYEKQTQAFFSK